LTAVIVRILLLHIYRVSTATQMLLLQLLCCYCTLTSSFATIAATNALSLVRVPRQTATLPLLLLTSFATITTAIASADATVARGALLTGVIVHMLELHFQKV